MKQVSERQLERFPIYLKYLLSMRDSGFKTISSPVIANALSFSEEQVRKDLQVVSSNNGKPKLGRDINELIEDIKAFLHYDNLTKAAVVGVGHLGKALMNYKGFNDFGLDIVCGFDIDSNLVGSQVNGKDIYSVYQLSNKIDELGLEIAILAVPLSAAQDNADRLVNAGIKGIWNFVPVHLEHPDNIIVENMDLARSLAVFFHRINKQ